MSFPRASLCLSTMLALGCAPAPLGDAGDEPEADAGDGEEDGGAPEVDEDGGPAPADGGPAPDGGPDGGGEPPPPPTITVAGTVIDFQSRAQLDVAANVTPVDILPPPSVSTTGASFTLGDVAGNSVFRLLVGGVGYRYTYSQLVQVAETSITGVTIEAASNAFISAAAAEHGVTLTAGQGVVIARAVDENGAGVAGVPASAFYLNGAAPAAGPYFLDAQRQPDDNLSATSASGYVLFFNVTPGDVQIGESPTSSYSLAAIPAPVDADAVTRVNVRAVLGDFVLPQDVDFQDDVLLVFDSKGCADCHSGSGIGRDLGGLTLDASPNLIYSEVTEELSPNHGVARVDTNDPEGSLLLLIPTTGPPAHPIQMFQGYSDPDYLTVLSWITDGALRN